MQVEKRIDFYSSDTPQKPAKNPIETLHFSVSLLKNPDFRSTNIQKKGLSIKLFLKIRHSFLKNSLTRMLEIVQRFGIVARLPEWF